MAKWRKKGAKWGDYPFSIASYDEDRKIHTPSMNTAKFSGNDIVVPVSLSTTFKIGDTMEMKIGDHLYEFKVVGFNEDFIYSSPMNMGTYLVYVSEKMYEQMEFENNNLARGKMIKTQLSKSAKEAGLSDDKIADDVANEWTLWHNAYQESHPDYTADLDGNFIPASIMSVAGMILPFIIIAIILVFALIILAVAMVVIDFSVKNFIIDNMKNTGIMEAGGYTVKEMMLILLVQLLSISFAGSFIGTLLAALLQGKIGIIMLFLLGLSWNQGPDLMIFAGVVLGICGMIAIFTLILGRDKTTLPISLTLALKETFGKFRAQIGVILMMTVLAFAAAMGYGIYENIAKDVDALLTISGLDLYDADFEGDVFMGDTVSSFESVDEIHYETWISMEFKKGKKSKSLTTRVISDTTVMNPKQMVEGRWPLYENEVAVGTSAANNLGVKVGDTILVKNGENEASYLVTGLLQTFNNMGMMGYISQDGFERIGTMPGTVSFAVNLKKGYTFDDLEKEFKDVYPDTELNDELASTGSLFPMLKASMGLTAVLVMLVTAFIVGLAEALLIRTRITKEWRNLGVNKALGFTSNQLIGQVMLSNIPSILIGIVLGLLAATFLGDKIVILMFSIFGFRKVSFVISPINYVLVCIVITGVALIVSWFNGRRIRNLEPVKMITEE